MRNKHTFIALTLCAILLLSGCSTGTPAETSVTAGEVTTTTTAEVTTTATTTMTTSVTTTTASKTTKPEDSEPEIDPLTAELRELTKKYLLFSDIAGMHLMAEQVAA